MKIYVSGPMKGYVDSNYAAFADAAAALRAKGYDTVSPHEVVLDGEPSYEEYMRADLRMLLDCTAVANLDGHQESKGASLENAVARMCGMDVRPLAEWLLNTSPPSLD